LTKNNYWKKALTVSETAVRNFHLIPLSTEIDYDLTNKYTDFEIRKLTNKYNFNDTFIGPKENCFLPWDEELSISPIQNNYQLILNKYPVQMGHMLLISNKWSAQNGWLSLFDFEAVATVNNDTSGLWFLNSCKTAGASQPHRHFQILPRKLDQVICPRYKWFNNYRKDNSKSLYRNSHVINFEFDNDVSDPEKLYRFYLILCNSLSIGNPSEDLMPLKPYNLILTNNWMALFSRTRDNIRGFSINSLGFAGYILCKTNSDVDWLNKYGPEHLLGYLT
tara:strand:+ start:3945 stop:4778 length:834 start_codon:yes stop_codon:yes gene_type:complete